MTRHDPKARESGFSLIELVVAMAVTLVISGAVFQLMSAGQTAFRREPALADRQQNIRMAIDLISQDVYRAGYGLPEFAQVFTENLDAVGDLGPTGEDTDELELFAASDCPTLTVCDVNGAQLTTVQPLSSCYALPALVILANSTEWHPYWAEQPGSGQNSACPASSGGSSGGGSSGGGNSGGGNSGGGSSGNGSGGNQRTSHAGGAADLVNAARTARRAAVEHAVRRGQAVSRLRRTANGNGGGNGLVTFPPGRSDFNNPGGPNQVFSNPPEWMLLGQVIRYRIREDAEGMPNLERSALGGFDMPGGGSSWQIIARGVEDLQVEYLTGAGWDDEPGTVGCGASCAAPGQAEFDTIVRRVRVTLSARADAANLQGQSTSAVGDAVRGQLETEVAPRAAVVTLGIFNGDF